MTVTSSISNETKGQMTDNYELPADVQAFLEYIGSAAKASGYLKWNEEAKIKADMMNTGARWSAQRVSAAGVRAKCLEVGLTDEESRTVARFVTRVQDGRKLVPHRSYRDYRFSHGAD